MKSPYQLTSEDRSIYEWQLDISGFGEAGQRRLRETTALVSRVGGLGGPLCFSLAAAGIGKLILAHAGNLKASDLNRQILMGYQQLDKERVSFARDTLQRFNPGVEVESVSENICDENVEALVGRADVVFSCAPLFEERLLMNEACVKQKKPLIDSAMFNLEGQVISVIPGKTPCLACVYPHRPPHWKRRFPVIGAVSALIANLGAIEGIKLISGLPGLQKGRLLHFDTQTMTLRKISLQRRPECPVCSEPYQTDS